VEHFTFRTATNRDTEKIISLVKTILPEFNLTYSPETSEQDLQDIEGTYTKNGGAFEVIENLQGEIIGTIALLKIDNDRCKMRKMYVHSHYRKKGLGHALLKRAFYIANTLDFKEIVLETVHNMTAAISLYKSYGFEEIEGQVESPRCNVLMVKRV
jgi:putative acetyltransferase